jgi:hypothetical protein
LAFGDRVNLTLATGGLAFASKGKARSVRNVRAQVLLERQLVEFDPFPRPGSRGVFEEGGVRIEGPEVMARDRSSARPTSRKLWWDDLDLLYFAAYALWNYVAVPHCLWDLPHHELPPWSDKDHEWRRIEVQFPPEIHTHSPVQTFYLDDAGRICRHDYVAEVFGRWARAAHFGSHHVKVGDAWLATRRKVLPRLPRGRPLRHPVLVWISLEDVRHVEQLTAGRMLTQC